MINMNDKAAWSLQEIKNVISHSMFKGMDGVLINMDEYASGDDIGEEATAILLEIEKAGFKWTWYNEDEYQVLIRW